MPEQSTRNIMMIEPAVFYANPQTMETNVYQIDENAQDTGDVYEKALLEFRAYRDLLVENGVIVTTAYGHDDSPDMVFPNWASTHEDGRLVIYPMLSENRRAERVPEIINFLKKAYPDVVDLTVHEQDGLFLEARGSIVCDRVNKIGYVALSPRTSKELAQKWGELMGYEMVLFDTRSHTGNAVYHTDLVMHIGTSYAGIVAPAIVEKDRARVLERIQSTHDAVEFSMNQLQTFCGNALEVQGAYNDKILTMSDAAFQSLTGEQREKMEGHFKKVLHSPLPTLEKYGGGSARCTLMELY